MKLIPLSEAIGQQTLEIIFNTPRQIVVAFLVERTSRGLSRGTVRYYQDELGRFCSWLEALGVMKIEEIDSDLIRRYLLHLSATSNPGGIHAAYRAIRAYFFWYEGEFEPESWKNPIRKVRAPKVSKQPLPGVPVEIVLKMVESSHTKQSKRDRAILLSLLVTGCRANELLALNIGDVDFLTGAIRIKHGKGNKARTVLVGQVCRKAIGAYVKTRDDIRVNSPLFVTDEGERLKYYGLVKIIKRRAENAGVDTPTPHDFRRCYAITMLRNGCDLARLAELMGHASLDVLMRSCTWLLTTCRRLFSWRGLWITAGR